ncbi:protein tyrosine phosphatase family protein [Parahaliea mediterranea]|uniref:protein tyrosine phosphatase family protein n=1 Tax=Parahaliea mediterranea TaxID=651086 RepID=UPI000E2EFCE1|nr:protein tyrosine phosphatase family protein [Parahaliea mediterranea]
MNDILNFYPITENIGTAGQPTREQFAQIAAAGYTAVINLAMPDSDNAIPEEGSLVSSLGMDYIHLPVPFDAPGEQHLQRFFGVMAALGDDRVFVHCALNMRVSAFMYKYLTLREGLDEARATSPLLQQWLPQMDPAWRRIIAMERSAIEG